MRYTVSVGGNKELAVSQEMPHGLTELTALSPLDGRYRKDIAELAFIASEYGLIKTRMGIEGKYLVALSDFGAIRTLTSEERGHLSSIGSTLTYKQVERVKEIEAKENHDVKAMEKTFREIVSGTSLEDVTEMIHFGLTSEDVNNLSYRLQLRTATEEIVLPRIDSITDKLIDQADKYKTTPMLARTHGQAAIPTTLGKEMVNFAVRLNKQTRKLEGQKLTGKLNGAVGNFSAQDYAFPDIDWIRFSTDFVNSLNLEPNLFTTQINPYDDIIEYMQNYQRINGVLLDFDQDMWRYISDDIFHQEVVSTETGSSTMAQKVNPIKFENSEGNLGIANGLIDQFTRKLPISRLQRDLSDSTVIRNLGTIMGHSLIGYSSAIQGIDRVTPDLDVIGSMLQKDWSVLAEPVQTLLRMKGTVDDPYKVVKELTHGGHLDEETWRARLQMLPISAEEQIVFESLKPDTYIGKASELTELAIQEIESSRAKK